MNEITERQKQIIKKLKSDYKISVNKNWFQKYLYMFSKFTQTKRTFSESMEIIIENPETFAYFIYGARYKYVSDKTGKSLNK